MGKWEYYFKGSLISVLSLGLITICGCQSSETKVNGDDYVVQRGFQQIVSDASKKIFPAVVYINVVNDNLQYGKSQSEVIFGSGVIISPDGKLLTNAHVVDKATRIRCQLNDESSYDAKVIGFDKDLDLALLALEVPEGEVVQFPYAKISQEPTAHEGDFVMAMGAPWGLNRSVSIGIISCSTRYLEKNSDYSLWYQTDAMISPGNSGGPLINTKGEIVAINTLGITWGGSIGFSIPSATILDVLPRFEEYGSINWAWLGLQLQPLRDFVKDINFDFDEGVIVSGTDTNSPSREAGFLPNDRIIAIDDVPVTIKSREALPELRRNLAMREFGKNIKFTVMRDENKIEISVAPIAKGEIEGDEAACPRWGLTVKAINRFDTPQLFYYAQEGVYIYGTAYPGNAYRAGLRDNDIIKSINGKPIKSLADITQIYDEAIANLDNQTRAIITVQRNGRVSQIVMDFSNNDEED